MDPSPTVRLIACRELSKMAARRRVELPARDKTEGLEEELLPEEGRKLLPLSGNAALRGGRALAMAEAMGERPSLLVRQPLLTNVASLAAGLLAGYGGSKALGAIARNRAEGLMKPLAGFAGGTGGRILATPLGALAARAGVQALREREISGIKERYRDRADGIRPAYDSPGMLHLPGPWHYLGQMEAVKALHEGELSDPLARQRTMSLLMGPRGARRQRRRTRGKARRMDRKLSEEVEEEE